jgi:hypothetical protein
MPPSSARYFSTKSPLNGLEPAIIFSFANPLSGIFPSKVRLVIFSQ